VNRRGPVLAAAASGVVIVIAILMFVLPKMSQVSNARTDLSKAKDQEQTLQGQRRALQDAQAAAPETKAQIAKLQNLLPPTADLPGLIQLVSSVSDRSSVDFFTLSPGAPTADPSGTFSTMVTQVNVTGGYFSIIDFLYRLETLQRAAKVTSISLSSAAASSGTETSGTTTTTANELNLQMTVEFYTTDSSAGPGSIPGSSTGGGTPGA
jgi:Tfp pilus assembly protein PilO